MDKAWSVITPEGTFEIVGKKVMITDSGAALFLGAASETLCYFSNWLRIDLKGDADAR